MATNQTSNARNSNLLKGARNLQSAWGQLKGELNQSTNAFARFPQFMTGARAYIVVSGKPIAVAQRVNYRIMSSTTEIDTIDTHLPWDFAIGQSSIYATLQCLIDPNAPAESDNLWATMASIVHQPMVELEIYDKLGNRLFWSRGLFVGLSVSIGMGAISERALEFRGIAYAHDCDQSFKPYDEVNAISQKLSDAAAAIRSKTGGLF